MIVVISLLLILSLLILLIGLINPRFIKMNSRKKVLVYGVPIVFVLFISGLISAPELTPEQRAQIEEKRKEEEVVASDVENKNGNSVSKTNEKEQDKKEVVDKEEITKTSDQPKESPPRNDSNVDKKAKNKPKKVEKDNSVVGVSKEVVYEIFKSGNDSIDETITDIEYDKDERALFITVKGKDGWSDGQIGLGFYEDSTSVYRSLSKDNRINELWVTITFPMKDKYGNVEDEEVMSTWMSRKTMDSINWKSFNYLDLIDVVDGKRVYPQFVQ